MSDVDVIDEALAFVPWCEKCDADTGLHEHHDRPECGIAGPHPTDCRCTVEHFCADCCPCDLA